MQIRNIIEKINLCGITVDVSKKSHVLRILKTWRKINIIREEGEGAASEEKEDAKFKKGQSVMENTGGWLPRNGPGKIC